MLTPPVECEWVSGPQAPHYTGLNQILKGDHVKQMNDNVNRANTNPTTNTNSRGATRRASLVRSVGRSLGHSGGRSGGGGGGGGGGSGGGGDGSYDRRMGLAAATVAVLLRE